MYNKIYNALEYFLVISHRNTRCLVQLSRLDITVIPETIHCLLPTLIKFQRYLEVPSAQPWVLPAVLHSYILSPLWEGAAMANNTIPCTGESRSTPPSVSGIPHTYTVWNSFTTIHSTLFLDFVHCFLFKKKELFQKLDIFPSWTERLERHLLRSV
jgi:hypothetical protein